MYLLLELPKFPQCRRIGVAPDWEMAVEAAGSPDRTPALPSQRGKRSAAISVYICRKPEP
jgi:hypothetical protein